MRHVLFVTAIVFASLAPLRAAQQAPPTTPPGRPSPTPATAPTTPPVPGVKPPSTTPDKVSVPTSGQVPSIGVPSTRFAPAASQTPRPGGGPTTPAVPAAATQGTSWQNVRLDVTISDSLNVDTQTKKTVSMLILDGRNGQVRSTSEGGLINIDANPQIRPDGRIYLRLTVEYRPELSAQQAQAHGTSRVTQFNESLAPLRSFVLPGGRALAAWAHLARTVCRRAERDVVTLARQEPINPQVVIYLNRLSDLLFVLARVWNDNGKADVLWVPGGGQQ